MKNIKPGDMVQIWDHQSTKPIANRLELHGKVGYVVKDQTKGLPPGLLWEVIIFDGDAPSREVINSDWLVKINDASDIKKKTQTPKKVLDFWWVKPVKGKNELEKQTLHQFHYNHEKVFETFLRFFCFFFGSFIFVLRNKKSENKFRTN